jgi:type I restriction enzyme, R subunit
LKELQDLADEFAKAKSEPEKLGLGAPEYALFTVLRAYTKADDEAYLAECARRMIKKLKDGQLLTPGWSASKGGRMQVEQNILVESWDDGYKRLGIDPNDPKPPFLKPAVDELATADP